MSIDTPDWAAYARIQQKIDTRTTLDDRAWGLEAAACWFRKLWPVVSRNSGRI